MEVNFEQLAHRAPLFTNKALRSLIIPLILERLLDMLVGMADTVMVASTGEAAVSGVALIDSINNLVLFVLAALATGGAVVVSQYLGRDDRKNARVAAKQLLYTTFAVAVVLCAVLLIFRDGILRLLFGGIEADVLHHAQTYCTIITLSFPFVALANSTAALFRSMGNSRVTLLVSLLMNALNISGNAILIYGYNMGVAGAAIASLASRIVACAVFLWLIHNPRHTVFIHKLYKIEFHPRMIRNILSIGIPSGLENGVFHLGKLLVHSLVTTFGTAAIAANAVVGQISSVAFVPGSAISLAIITVIGQCMGASDHEQALLYTKKLMRMIYLIQGAVSIVVFLLVTPAMRMFNLGAAASALGTQMLLLTLPFMAALWPMAFPFANVLRAAGDVRYTMFVSIASMWLFRVGMSYVIEYFFAFGLPSVYIAMLLDWAARAICFMLRFKGGKWKTMHVV